MNNCSGQPRPTANWLGVSSHTTARVERAMTAILVRNGSLREMFDALETLDLTFNEWTSAVFALGYFNGQHFR
jgi:hypothetical protein